MKIERLFIACWTTDCFSRPDHVWMRVFLYYTISIQIFSAFWIKYIGRRFAFIATIMSRQISHQTLRNCKIHFCIHIFGHISQTRSSECSSFNMCYTCVSCATTPKSVKAIAFTQTVLNFLCFYFVLVVGALLRSLSFSLCSDNVFDIGTRNANSVRTQFT